MNGRMNVLVTGGAGFIGSHLVRAIVELGHQVFALDDLSSGKLENLPSGVTFLHKSVVDLAGLEVHNIDVIYHLAAIASVPKSVDNPMETFVVNVGGTVNVLEAARLASVKKVVFASSCAVYGDCYKKMGELDIPRPLSPYAWSKLVCEQYCDMYTKLYSLPTVCLRYFNVFGEKQALSSQYGLVVPRFINCATHNISLPIYGDGKQTRDFIFIDDAIDATILSSKEEMTGVYNVGSGDNTSISDLAGLIISITGSKSCIEFHEPRAGDPLHTRANVSRIMKEGFVPGWSLEAGLRRTIGHARKFL